MPLESKEYFLFFEVNSSRSKKQQYKVNSQRKENNKSYSQLEKSIIHPKCIELGYLHQFANNLMKKFVSTDDELIVTKY